MNFELNKKLEEYIEKHSSKEDELLKKINRETHAKLIHPRMVSGHIQGKMLEMFSYMINPENILEIGTYTGYSAVCLAKGLKPNGKLITIEINDELEDFTRNFLTQSENSKKIDFLIGDALDIIPKLNEQFDLVFIDGEKSSYIEYFEVIFPKLKNGGFVLADNTLWSGKVVEEKIRNNDYFTKGILKFNEYIVNRKDVEVVILPFRDGLSVIRKADY